MPDLKSALAAGGTSIDRRCTPADQRGVASRFHRVPCRGATTPARTGRTARIYAGEIAVNHCAPEAQCSKLLEAHSTSAEPITRHAHIHCWHTDQKFSKHWFMSRRYTRQDSQDLDMSIIRDYCMALSFRSLDDLAAVRLASACKARING
jgi:hypothetical protein